MKILIFIPTFNAEKFLEKQIKMLQKQTVNGDIYVVDSSSTDTTTDILKKYNINYEIIQQNEFNHGFTRNKVLEFKEYDYYMFLTQDAIPCDEFLVERLLNGFIDNVKIAYAKQVPYEFSNDIEKYAREYNYPNKNIIKTKKDIKNLGIKTFFTSNSCCMYDADYFRNKQGFIKSNVSEDMEFAYRCVMDGYSVAYVSDARVCHSHLYNIRSLYKRYFEIGKFFCYHKEFLKYKTSNEGIKQTGYILKKLLQKKKYLLIFKLLIETFIKYIAFKKGLKGC